MRSVRRQASGEDPHSRDPVCGNRAVTGDIVNTDAAFLSRRPAELGIAVYRRAWSGTVRNGCAWH